MPDMFSNEKIKVKTRTHTYEDHLINFKTFFVWALLLIVNT